MTTTITQQLDALAACYETIKQAKESKIINTFFSTFSIEKDHKTAEEMKEILNWFVDGGTFTTYWRESVPYGERKNSKKRQTTTWFNVSKKGIEFQLGHTTSKNYIADFWERGVESLVKSALCKEGEFSYYNGSFIDYVLEKDVAFTDLGEKK
jgi:hypothetical protein